MSHPPTGRPMRVNPSNPFDTRLGPNPFGDDDGDGDDGGGVGGGNTGKGAPRRPAGSNPFDDGGPKREGSGFGGGGTNPFGPSGGGSNPFDDNGGGGGGGGVVRRAPQDSHAVSGAGWGAGIGADNMTSTTASISSAGGGSSSAAPTPSAGSGPGADDFDPDFGSPAGAAAKKTGKRAMMGKMLQNVVRKGGGGGGGGGGGDDGQQNQPILAGIDGADDDHNSPSRPRGLGGKGRAKTSGEVPSGGGLGVGAQAFAKNIMRKGGGGKGRGAGSAFDDDDAFDNPAAADDRGAGAGGRRRGRHKKGKAGAAAAAAAARKMKIQRWPYDDYHREQERYYESLGGQDTPELGGGTGNGNGNGYGVDDYSDDDRNGGEGYCSGSDDEKKDDRFGGKSFADDGNRFYERPAELPSIKEAVQGLSLVDFERKAQERAIGIVSTWLFDAGLIDELLVNGAVSSSSSSLSHHPGGMGPDGSAPDVGVEVGAHGFPLMGSMEGALKMDKEIEKLRASAQRELSLINARLNDGVAASGAEVQELVNAVATTKDDLGQLRELLTYITDSSAKTGLGRGTMAEKGRNAPASSSSLLSSFRDPRDEFLLSDCPRLKNAISARKNIGRCFRELEFFAQIPSTCDRLRDELHSGEWTADEWNTIRNVCMEHVELEILLVEAEAGMKARADDLDDSDEEEEKSVDHHESRLASTRKLRDRFKSHRGLSRNQSQHIPGYYEMVDKFLSVHVKNVWELGDEIKMRIMSGIGSAFDLALNNPAGMVALVEAVEVYERAAEQYNALYEGDDKTKADGGGSDDDASPKRLHFTDMRAAALSQMYQDFELRGLEVFRAIHMQAADSAETEDAESEQFSAVLRAATELVAEIELVKNEISPCFAPHWAVEVLWSSCVAHVCSNQIIQQIGGPEGNALPGLTVTQLLDVVAWVEFFRETIEESFPEVSNMHAKKTYFDTRPDLFEGDKKTVNMESATDSLAWVNNMLWEVHRLAQEEFLVRTRTQTEEWLQKSYAADHAKNQTAEGRLTTSLCEDVFSFASVQLRTIRERLSKKSDALLMSVCLIFSTLRSKQIHSRDGFLQDLETCCAAANDFTRMSEKCEEVMQELIDESDFSAQDMATLEASSGELLAIYSADAVYAAQSVHIYIFEPIKDAIVDELFGPEWLESLTHNELALTLTRTLEDFMGDLEQFIDEFLLKKSVDSLVQSSVVFYIKALLQKAESHASNKHSYFSDNQKALERIAGDVRVMREYFDGIAEDMPALAKVVENEFEILATIQELLAIAAEVSVSDASDFILMLHKRVRDIDLTKHCVGDLWHLVNPKEERAVWELVESLEDTLLAVAPPDESIARQARDRLQAPGLRLDEALAMHVIESKRKRPVKPGAVEKVMTKWNRGQNMDDRNG